MNEEASFLDAIRRDQADETARLVYADWLDDRSDPRAEFLRIETRLLHVEGPNDPAALARWFELRDRVPTDWLAALGPRVNGLPLPHDLPDLLATGYWGYEWEVSSYTSPWGNLTTCSLEEMDSGTRGVCFDLPWLGKPDLAHPPGDIDPRLTVLICDEEGIGKDTPFVLDYRATFGRPRVLRYRWRIAASDKPTGNRWVEVAPSFAAFWAQLGRRS